MKIQWHGMALTLIVLSGCGSGGCPTIYVPVYEINVYDGLSGDLICYEGVSSRRDLQECEIAYTYPGGSEAADITVSLDGYETEVLYSVENETWRPGCWDNPEHTTNVDIYLTR